MNNISVSLKVVFTGSLVSVVLTGLFSVMQAQEKLGPVDMLVNCAGTAVAGKFEEMEVERFKVSSCKPFICISVEGRRCRRRRGTKYLPHTHSFLIERDCG